jgi:hypothetical protein
MSFPTRNRDADREILKKMDDRAFLTVCTAMLNKDKDDYMEKLCNGDKYYPNLFELRLKTDPKYVGAYAYKPSNMSWRKYFASVIIWFEKLKTLEYDFTGKRGDPKVYFDVLSQQDPKDITKFKQINRAIDTGYLDLVADSAKNVVDVNTLSYFIYIALIRKQIDIATYFFNKGAVINSQNIETLLNNGNKEAIDFILTTGDFDYAKWFRHLNNQLRYVKYGSPEDVQRKTQQYKEMIDHLFAKFKLTLPVLPKFTMKK